MEALESEFLMELDNEARLKKQFWRNVWTKTFGQNAPLVHAKFLDIFITIYSTILQFLLN